MRKVPLKNYFILGVILVISTLVVLYLNRLYLSTKSNDTVLSNFIKEIKSQEIDNYIVENPDFIIYLNDKTSKNSKFEKKFKKLLVKYDLQKDIVFIDSNLMSEKQYNDLITKYSLIKFNNNNNKSNCLIIIDNQKIVDIMTPDDGLFNIDDVKKFFKENGVY